jgi:hypothetical protein
MIFSTSSVFLMRDMALFILSMSLLQGCGRSEGGNGHVRYHNADPHKVQLELFDSLISNGGHRMALVLIDSFQRVEADSVYLIQSEVLRDRALDSLYGE